ncbi:flagellar hook-associated protein FlgL [Pseudobacteriovorax antillogorgiicola]|uniref:Flagellar hook-associated protein 3 FlgL n=1 Tax=Pseudobacteriovorax antillogorgiicola TaxID=1513793 RepID=A0A1Y6B273_9BACT|nr:flagellar hook-associated protein FlgL [Pseudobacteriovorax antillogorgiicola]TCS59533.1 flagellar hook-associated protein 3 FlgL [Pseudobacteriovorax antillogorgiicola]SME87817.1 flagellar hook-associated protein 3 FlgL [Pseudobacteriovorax antillogorgiicola]
MRVSDNQRYRQSQNRVNHAKAGNSKMTEQISTQRKLNRVSDDPIGLGRTIKYKASLKDNEQFQKNIEFTKGFIERSEASLRGISDFLIRAKELAVSLANDTYGPDSRAAAAKEVGQIIQGVVAQANAQYGNRYVFGGFRTLTPPLSRDGVFLGDDGAIFLQVDHGGFEQINLQPRELFEAGPAERSQGHFGMIQSLEILRDSLEGNDVPGVRTAMEELDHQIDKTTTFMAKMGSIHNGVNNTLRRLEISSEITTQEVSNIEDADTFKAISDFKKTEDILQSTLMASNKLLQPSLLNFMQ